MHIYTIFLYFSSLAKLCPKKSVLGATGRKIWIFSQIFLVVEPKTDFCYTGLAKQNNRPVLNLNFPYRFNSKERKMLEKMGEFFNARLDGYEEHQMNTIESAREFYPFTAACLPRNDGARVLDLGCGTGLELEEFFRLNPGAFVTGIDLAKGMLDFLRAKFVDKKLELVHGSYFDLPFGENLFDAALSVESLHHFTKEEKIPLYAKLRNALKSGGYFILTDYFALSDEDEAFFRGELIRLRKEQNLSDGEFYHYDTPLTVAHEREALLEAGFSSVEELKSWGVTHTLRAFR